MGKDTQSVLAALYSALRSVEVDDSDAAAVALAKRYAALVDADPDMADKVGPKLLDALRELRMTPKARSGVVSGGSDGEGKPGSKLDELKRRRAARQHGAASVDPAGS